MIDLDELERRIKQLEPRQAEVMPRQAEPAPQQIPRRGWTFTVVRDPDTLLAVRVDAEPVDG